MASKIKKIIKQPRMIILLIFVAIALFSIPNLKPAGVAVAYVAMDSPFYQKLEADTLIIAVNGVSISTLDDYTAQISKVKIGDNVSISTKDAVFRAVIQADQKKPDVQVPYLGLNVKATKSTNFEQGLDLQGGARVVLRPVPIDEEAPVNDTLVDTTASVLMARMNAYGLKNVVVRQIKDVNGLSFIEVAMAGEGSESVVDIVKSVGLFELKVLNETILTGEYIVPPIGEPQRDGESGLWQVAFAINNEGAKIFRESYVAMAPKAPLACTSDKDCNESYACSRDYTSGVCLPKIEMFLDNTLQYSAPPARSLYSTWQYGEDSKNLVVQTGVFEDAQKVKIVLEAGRLPKDVKELRVYSQDYVDPKLGKNFTRGALLAGLASILAVLIVVFVRYRSFKVVIPVMLFDLFELIILLGFAAIIKWSLDLPGIAGIIAVIGTAVNQQIIMTDQVKSGETSQSFALKKNVKTAFGIMVASASTVIASMLPLAYPGFTGLYALRGFAIVTILGLLIGLFITRPAFAKVAEILYGEELSE